MPDLNAKNGTVGLMQKSNLRWNLKVGGWLGKLGCWDGIVAKIH
jgi:hypothetical protein